MQERLSETESGLTHEYLPLTVRCADDGRIYLQAGDHAGIVIDSQTGKITLYGTAVNIVSGEFQLDGMPVDKPSILSRARAEVNKLIDRSGLKRAIRSRQ